jgi:hypothetical protein
MNTLPRQIPTFEFGSLEDFDLGLNGLENANLYITGLYNWNNPNEETKKLTQELYQVSKKSYFENLKDIDAHIVLTNPNIEGEYVVKSLDCFYDAFLKTFELWKRGHNIFYGGIDTVCVRPTEVFGKFDKFSMFNGVGLKNPLITTMSETNWYQGFNQGSVTTETFGQIEIPAYFNCDVRYIPSNTSELIWNIGFREWDKYFEQKETHSGRGTYIIHGQMMDGLEWGIEQVIYNIMMYEGQEWNNNYESLYRADLNNFNMRDSQFLLNEPSFESPFPIKTPIHIYQVWGSRGLKSAIGMMKNILENVKAMEQ